jgi:hypothetical protein
MIRLKANIDILHVKIIGLNDLFSMYYLYSYREFIAHTQVTTAGVTNY